MNYYLTYHTQEKNRDFADERTNNKKKKMIPMFQLIEFVRTVDKRIFFLQVVQSSLATYHEKFSSGRFSEALLMKND